MEWDSTFLTAFQNFPSQLMLVSDTHVLLGVGSAGADTLEVMTVYENWTESSLSPWRSKQERPKKLKSHSRANSTQIPICVMEIPIGKSNLCNFIVYGNVAYDHANSQPC